MTPLLEQSISDIFRTFLNEEPLENALEHLREKYAEFPFAINVQRLDDRHYTSRTVLNVEQEFHDSFAHVAQHNPLPPVLARANLGQPLRIHHHVRKADVHPEYLSSFIEKNNNIDRSIAMMIGRQNGSCSYVNICLPDAVSEADEELLFQEVAALQPHFQNALELALQRQIREVSTPCNGVGKFWLEQMPFSALVVDECGCVQAMNERAEKLLGHHANLHVGRCRKIAAKASQEAAALEAAIRQAIVRNTAPKPVVVRNEIGPNTLVFTQAVETLNEPPAYLSQFLVLPKLCLVMVFDPTDFAEVPDKMISHLLDLTPKETEVVKVLTNGASTREAADQLGITYNTVRNHIANISRRLDVRSQTEILRLVMTTLSRFPWA